MWCLNKGLDREYVHNSDFSRGNVTMGEETKVGIPGVDLHHTVIQCNAKWFELPGVSPAIISKDGSAQGDFEVY
jgi:hypothetical protein